MSKQDAPRQRRPQPLSIMIVMQGFPTGQEVGLWRNKLGVATILIEAAQQRNLILHGPLMSQDLARMTAASTLQLGLRDGPLARRRGAAHMEDEAVQQRRQRPQLHTTATLDLQIGRSAGLSRKRHGAVQMEATLVQQLHPPRRRPTILTATRDSEPGKADGQLAKRLGVAHTEAVDVRRRRRLLQRRPNSIAPLDL